MRFLGKEYDGTGAVVAIVDSGVNANDPRLAGARIEGWSLALSASGHASIGPDFTDQIGHGTDLAVAVHRIAPSATILAVKIMGERLRAPSELMGAGIETASLRGAHVITLSIGTPNMNKALRLRECCGQAMDRGSLVLAATHPNGDRIYPAELPETLAVASHRECPTDKFFYFDPKRFPRKVWPSLADKFLAYGGAPDPEAGGKTPFRGTGIATAWLAGHVACLRQALPDLTAPELIDRLKTRALLPMPELGYS